MAKFSASLSKTLLAAFKLAEEHRHQYLTLEHLLVALTDDETATDVLRACNVDCREVRADADAYLKQELGAIVVPTDKALETKPTNGVQRIIQRVMLQADAEQSPEIFGDDVLVALFSERESHAAYFLQNRDITRYDLLPFVTEARKQRAAAVIPPDRKDPPTDAATARRHPQG